MDSFVFHHVSPRFFCNTQKQQDNIVSTNVELFGLWELLRLKINLIGEENPVYSWKKSLNEKYTAPTGGRKAVLPEPWHTTVLHKIQ